MQNRLVRVKKYASCSAPANRAALQRCRSRSSIACYAPESPVLSRSLPWPVIDRSDSQNSGRSTSRQACSRPSRWPAVAVDSRPNSSKLPARWLSFARSCRSRTAGGNDPTLAEGRTTRQPNACESSNSVRPAGGPWRKRLGFSSWTCRRRVVDKYPGHTWHVDVTTVPTRAGFWVPWFPFTLPQSWPFCWWVAVAIDQLSRVCVGFAVFAKCPSSVEVQRFLDRAARAHGKHPRYVEGRKHLPVIELRRAG